MKYGVLICIGIMIVLLLFAPYLVIPFSYSDSTIGIRDQMAYLVAVSALFLPFTPFGYTSAGYFQAMGWGYKSFLITCVVNLIRIPICLFLAAYVGTLESLWWGIVAAEITGSLFGGLYAMLTIRKFLNGGYPDLLAKEDFVMEG